MSWGVSAIGRAPAVGAAIERQFESGKCAEPEESIRQAARALIAASIAAQDSAKVIRVQAYGSQSTEGSKVAAALPKPPADQQRSLWGEAL